MPPRNRSFAFQQLMNQVAAPSDTTGSFRQVQRDELFPGVISRDFARSRATDPTISKYDEAYGGNPIMDLAESMYQGGVGDTRGTGGMPGSGSDPMNFTPPAEPPMQTGSFRRVPRPIFDAYSEGMEGMAGMPGSGSSDMIPFYNAQNVVEQQSPRNMEIRPFEFGEIYPSSVPGFNYSDGPTPSFRTDVLPPQDTLDRTKTLEGGIADTETAYLESLPGANVAQAFRDREIKRQEEGIKKQNDAIYQQGLKDNPFLSEEQSLEDFLPRDYKAEARQIADKTARGIGGAARGLAGFSGNILNALLYGNTKRDLASNLNQTLYGGKRSLRENVLGMPAPKQLPQSQGQGIGPTPSGKPMDIKGGFKGAFAAARKAGKKEFTYKGKKYTTALASSGAKTAVKKPVAKKTAAKKTRFKKRGTVTRYSGRENARRGN